MDFLGEKKKKKKRTGEPNWISNGIFSSVSAILKWATLCRCALYLFRPPEEDRLLKWTFCCYEFEQLDLAGGDSLRAGDALQSGSSGDVTPSAKQQSPEPCDILSVSVYGPTLSKAKTP